MANAKIKKLTKTQIKKLKGGAASKPWTCWTNCMSHGYVVDPGTNQLKLPPGKPKGDGSELKNRQEVLQGNRGAKFNDNAKAAK